MDEALRLALQIAEGMEAAHEKGITHRDLKPANIKIPPESEVKTLDFGLAKALEKETPISNLSHSPTITHAATEPKVTLGTASYMSPEQTRGKPVDKRMFHVSANGTHRDFWIRDPWEGLRRRRGPIRLLRRHP